MAEMELFDIVVIGAGIHGAGVAQAAAAAGYRVLVVERTAPAAATSSRSSKLIHGGLRYLETGQVRLVREALREQRLLLRNAPELVRPLRFYLPIYRNTGRRSHQVRMGLMLYTLLGNHRGFRRVPLRQWENPDDLDTRDLEAVFTFQDAQTDDAALTRAVLGSAMGLGAKLECPAEVVEIKHMTRGYLVEYRKGDTLHGRYASAVVNAAGPWVNEVLARVRPRQAPLALEPVQGAHLLVSGAMAAGGYYLEAPRDRRGVFALPWRDDLTLVGTTESRCPDDPGDVRPLPEEIDYLREVFAHYFPTRACEVTDAYAGVRMLPSGSGAAFVRSRETLLASNAQSPPRLLTVCGGKLTTYRATAQKVLRRLIEALPEPRPRPKADTRTIWLMPVD